MDFLDRFEPQAVIRHFVNICNIPHPSGHEEGVREYVRKCADEHGHDYHIDEGGNIIVYVKASPGCEGVAPYMIQAHMDMVPAKEAGSTHDFLKDPISLRLVDDHYLYANGTTLGADNAVGMMYMLTLMEDDTVIHPPLELLFTTREEVGLQGIREVDFSKISSRRMMNMDCGEPGVMCVSTAGAAQCLVKLPLTEEALCGSLFKLSVSGLLGGHGGLLIDSGRLSAVSAVGRILCAMARETSYNIIDAHCPRFSGIPTDMQVLLALPQDGVEKAQLACDRVAKELCAEYADPEKDLTVKLSTLDESADRPAGMLTADCSLALARLLYLIPFGVTRRDFREKETVLCSNNTVEVFCRDGFAQMEMMVRSPLDTVKQDVVDRIEMLAGLCGAQMILLDSFAGWPYRGDSPMQRLCRETYRELTGKELVIEKENACAETGPILGAIPDMDCIATAPYSKGAHTPKEHLDLETVGPFWEFLKLLLKKMCDSADDRI